MGDIKVLLLFCCIGEDRSDKTSLGSVSLLLETQTVTHRAHMGWGKKKGSFSPIIIYQSGH